MALHQKPLQSQLLSDQFVGLCHNLEQDRQAKISIELHKICFVENHIVDHLEYYCSLDASGNNAFKYLRCNASKRHWSVITR